MREGQIVVTGASRGIGAAIAQELTRRGADVACLSRSGKAPVGRGIICDVSDEEAIRATLADIAQAGPIAGLVNNAGIHLMSPSAELSTETYEQVMRVNATSMLLFSREAYPYLKQAGGGMIVNMGSFFDKMGVPQNLAYCASKAVAGAITRCLAVEWAADGITVLNVAPGYIETDLNREFLAKEKVKQWISQRIPTGQVGQPQDVARLVGCLFDEEMPFFTGETLYLDGGQGMNH